MKKYERPNFEITSYESEDIITLSTKTDLTTNGVQGAVGQDGFKEISF